jgi:hypothetical protein
MDFQAKIFAQMSFAKDFHGGKEKRTPNYPATNN